MEYTEDLFECIEERNKEYNALLRGAEYNKGVQIQNIKSILKHFDIKGLIDAVRYKITEHELMKYKKPVFSPELLRLTSTYDSYVALKEKRIVVYTCITDNYDFLKEPVLDFDNVRYICFSDHMEEIQTVKNTKWEIIRIPDKISSKYNTTMANRYIKLHPHEFFQDADYSIYVDGNVKIVSFLGSYLMKTKAKTGIAVYAHNQRGCAYAEANACILRKKGNKENIEQQMKKYSEEGFPENFGLYECTIIAVDLKNDTSCRILETWWKEFVDSQSLRDQLSLPYVMWKNGFQYTDIGLLGANIFDDCRITVYSHR